MKKFVSLLLALVMALSIGVVGFAADDAQNTCPKCEKPFDTEAAFNKHLVECYDLADDAMECPYEGCDAKFFSKTEYEKHISKDVCPYYVEKTEMDELKEAVEDKDIKGIFEVIIGLLSKIDFEGLLAKIDLEGLLSKIDLEGIFNTIKEALPKVIDAVKNLA